MKKRLALLAIFLAMVVGGSVTSLAGDEKTIEGTLVDSRCYLANAHEKEAKDHGALKRCGEACARAGWPVGLVTDKGKYFMLVVLPSQLAENIGQTLRATGTLSGGSLVPTKLEVKKDKVWEEIKFIQAVM